MKNKRDQNREFSIELESRGHLKNVSLADDSMERVLVEGTIGELLQATFAEGIVLEVVGRNGVIRIDLADNEIKRMAKQDGTVEGGVTVE